MARTLLRGRVRLSTVLVTLLFAVTFTTYLLVRPTPASIVHGNQSGYTTPVSTTSSSRAPTPRPSPSAARPSPTPVPSPSRLPASVAPSTHTSPTRASASNLPDSAGAGG
jgi:hypothetical protein